MARISLRQYLTSSELQEYEPSVESVDTNILIKAEQDIDNALANFANGWFSKAFNIIQEFNECTFSGVNGTISNFNAEDGYLSRTVCEIVSGAKSGKRFFITSQTGSVITLSSNPSITGTVAIKVYQLAKAPFVKDKNSYSQSGVNKTSKVIDERIKEAVALQYVYRRDNDLDVKYKVKGYSVNGADYSETFDVGSPMSIKERISPQAWDIISSLTVQSLK